MSTFSAIMVAAALPSGSMSKGEKGECEGENIKKRGKKARKKERESEELSTTFYYKSH